MRILGIDLGTTNSAIAVSSEDQPAKSVDRSSAKWPGPNDPGFTRAPTLHDFSTMQELPDHAFAPSRL